MSMNLSSAEFSMLIQRCSGWWRCRVKAADVRGHRLHHRWGQMTVHSLQHKLRTTSTLQPRRLCCMLTVCALSKEESVTCQQLHPKTGFVLVACTINSTLEAAIYVVLRLVLRLLHYVALHVFLLPLLLFTGTYAPCGLLLAYIWF